MDNSITIYLDREIPEKDLWKCCFTAKSFKEAVDRGDELIITTQTHAINSYYYEKGYDIILKYKNGTIKFSDILAGAYSEYIREIKISHNWEKMFYSGLFYIPGIFEYEV